MIAYLRAIINPFDSDYSLFAGRYALRRVR